MRSFFDWFSADASLAQVPWLLLGKGPSFSKRTAFDLSAFATVGLNHVVREQAVLVAHAIDLEVIETCGEALLSNAGFLAMPWYPHIRTRPLPWAADVRFYPTDLGLDDWCERIPVLGRLALENRLLYYNLSTSFRPPRRGGPLVRAHAFSSTVALNLLAAAGVRSVRSLGIDGGRSYSADFSDLNKQTLLVAGQSSFDLQFQGFADTIWRDGPSFAPLDSESPIPFQIRGAESDELPGKVLAYSLRRRASASVEIRLHEQPAARISVGPRALVTRDVRELGDVVFHGMGATVDLHRLNWDGLVVYAEGQEPWREALAPGSERWCRELLAGISEGALVIEDVIAAVRKGHVRPSLMEQVERKLSDPRGLPRAILARETEQRVSHLERAVARAGQGWTRSPLRGLAEKVRARLVLDPVNAADLAIRLGLRLRRRGFRVPERSQR
jgi:hypothetical protein